MISSETQAGVRKPGQRRDMVIGIWCGFEDKSLKLHQILPGTGGPQMVIFLCARCGKLSLPMRFARETKRPEEGKPDLRNKSCGCGKRESHRAYRNKLKSELGPELCQSLAEKVEERGIESAFAIAEESGLYQRWGRGKQRHILYLLADLGK